MGHLFLCYTNTVAYKKSYDYFSDENKIEINILAKENKFAGAYIISDLLSCLLLTLYILHKNTHMKK